MIKKTITKQEKLQLLGLVTLGRQHYKMVDSVRDAISEIIEDEDTNIHDMTWEYDKDLDHVLKDMGIQVGK